MMAAGESAIYYYMCILKAANRSPQRGHEVPGKSVIYYPHHEGA
jgi:hypothetical protein